jgi:hypothetical protein
MSYEPKRDENTLGEHRLLRDLNRVDSLGSITSIQNSGGSPNTVTVTGIGTDWSRLGNGEHTHWNTLTKGGGVTATDLAFCFDPLAIDGYDMCFPVSAITDNTHLTLNLFGVGCEMNCTWAASWPVSGTYRIYRAAWATSIDLPTHTLTAEGVAGFEAGDRIDQVLAYNTQMTGQYIWLSRHLGLPNTGGGLDLKNVGSQNSPSMKFGVSVSGAFESAVAFQESNQPSGSPMFFSKLYSDPRSAVLFDSTSAMTTAPAVSLWRLRDSAGGTHTLLHFDRAKSTICVEDSSLCVSPGGYVTMSHLNQKNPNQFAGRIEISGSDSGAVSFSQPFKSDPACTLTPTSNPTAVGAYWVEATPTSVKARTARLGRISFNYLCIGNPD